MRAEDLKAWMKGAEQEENVEKEDEGGHKGAGGTCRLFVRLLQHV